MKTIFKLSLCICIFFIGQTSNAQLLKRIQERVEAKAEQKATEEAEKAADRMMDKVLGNQKKKKQTNGGSKTSYVFDQSITLEIESDDNEKTHLDFLFNSKNDSVFCMKLNADGEDAGEVYAVVTPTSSTMFMNMPGMKIKKTVTKEELGSFDYTDKVPEGATLKKTGKTKTILGYTCHEYFYENDGGKVYAWVASDFPIKEKFIPILGMKKNDVFEGFVLELHFEGSNEKATIKVIKVTTNANLKINANEYTSM